MQAIQVSPSAHFFISSMAGGPPPATGVCWSAACRPAGGGRWGEGMKGLGRGDHRRSARPPQNNYSFTQSGCTGPPLAASNAIANHVVRRISDKLIYFLISYRRLAVIRVNFIFGNNPFVGGYNHNKYIVPFTRITMKLK